MTYETNDGNGGCMDASGRRGIEPHSTTREPYHYRIIAARPSRSGRDGSPTVLTVEKIDGTPPGRTDPSQGLLKMTGGRLLFTPENRLSDRSLMFIQPPDFPSNDLVGKLLIPLAPFGGPDASLLAVASVDQHEAAHG